MLDTLLAFSYLNKETNYFIRLYKVDVWLRKLNIFLRLSWQEIVPPVTLNSHNIQKSTSSHYLVLILDQRLTRADHVKSKRIRLNSRRKSFHYLKGKHSKFSIKTKLFLYKTPLMSVWTSGIQLWRAAKQSNI